MVSVRKGRPLKSFTGSTFCSKDISLKEHQKIFMSNFSLNQPPINTLFRPHRDHLSRHSYRHARNDAFELWNEVSKNLIGA